MNQIGDAKRRLGKIKTWDAPFDLSIAPPLFFLLLIPSTLNEQRSAYSTRTVVLWTGIKLCTIAIWLAPLDRLNHTLKWFKTRRIKLILGGIIGAVLGATSGTFVFYAANLLNVNHPDENLQRRIFSTALLGFAWLPIGIVISQSFGNIRRNAYGKEGSPHTLVRKNFKSTSFYKSFQRETYNSIEAELTDISHILANELAALAPNKSMSLSNAEKILEKLKTNSFRDLSIQIERSVPEILQMKILNLRIFTWRNYVSVIFISAHKDMKKNPLNPRIFSYVITIIFLGTQIRNNKSIFYIIVFSSLTAAITYAMSSLVVFYWGKTKKYFFEFSIFGLALNAALIVLIQEYMRTHGYDSALSGPQPQTTFLVVPFFLFIYFLGHFGNAGMSATVDVFRVREFSKIAEAIQDEMLRGQKRIIGRRWAVHIHGKIQTRISSSALAIQQAIAQNDSSAIFKTINALQVTLAKPSDGVERIDRVLEKEVEARFAPWTGLLEHKASIEPSLHHLDATRVRVVGDVLEEMISNAVRHGGATQITIRLSMRDGGDIELYGEDNSIYPPYMDTYKNLGIGTTIFNSASLGRWKLERDQDRGKTVFKIRISSKANFDIKP